MEIEQCPLAGKIPAIAIEHIPDICMRQCFELWDAATTNMDVHGEYDVYPVYVDEWSPCDHEGTEIETSHEALQTLDSPTSSLRIYTVVDLCMADDCGDEVGEQAYEFHCPFNKISTHA